jgi:2-keto-4-pentenoate hydratase
VWLLPGRIAGLPLAQRTIAAHEIGHLLGLGHVVLHGAATMMAPIPDGDATSAGIPEADAIAVAQLHEACRQ